MLKKGMTLFLVLVILLAGCENYDPTSVSSKTDLMATVPSEPTEPTTTETAAPTEPTGTTSHVHSYYGEKVAPTCTEDGYIHHSCACGDFFDDTFTSALGHDWSSWKTVTEPTTESEGLQTRSCAACGAEDQQVLEKLESPHVHDYMVTVVAATCTTEGYTLHTCICGDHYQTDEVPTLAHTWGEWELTVAPTEEAEGEQVRTCTVCGASDKAAVEKLPEHAHQYTEEVIWPTCTEPGKKVFTCTCGHSYEETYGEPTGHTWGEWEVTTPPTEETEGEQVRICVSCGATDRVSVDKLPAHAHQYTEEVIQPTCTEPGRKIYTCTCGHSYEEAYGEPAGHNWGEWEVTIEPTTTHEGEKIRTCQVCGVTETAIIEKVAMEGGFVIISWTETVGRGEEASVTICGVSGVEYSITVYYKSGPSKADGLEPTVADVEGYVTWTWKVGGKTTPGTYEIVISGGGSTQTIYFTVEADA